MNRIILLLIVLLFGTMISGMGISKPNKTLHAVEKSEPSLTDASNRMAQHTYRTLDPSNPLIFKGKYIIYKGNTIPLGPKAFFIDGQLSDEEVKKYPYVFNSVNKAAQQLADGTEASPMTLYIAPYVYWIDNPDDPQIRESNGNEPPFGLVIKCKWLRFYGLSDKAENVVLACNRGQTIGAKGNFTMFRIYGDGTSSENITFGNYCNVDLVFPLKPELNQEKRASAIVQAQLILCDGDKITARNTRFISRLNLCPFVGGKRVLFDRCHFESTDDALCGTGIYLNSTFDFYSSKPFYNTVGTGAVFLNCDIHSYTRGEQYLTKAGGQVAVVDSRISGNDITYPGWQDITSKQTRNYQSNVLLNGEKILIGKRDSLSTIDMQDKPILHAYRFTRNGKTIYNTYNLLRGNDDWDPMGIKPTVIATEKETDSNLTNQPTRLLFSPKSADLETKKDTLSLNAFLYRFGNYTVEPKNIRWKIESGNKSVVNLQPTTDGKCLVIPVNTTDETQQVVVTAYTDEGLEAASVLNIAPAYLNAPSFSVKPGLKLQNGKLQLHYKLNTRYDDESIVNWYRCSDNKGSDPIEIAVSRMNKPLLQYETGTGDVGYHMMATIAPKHKRCKAGSPVSVITKDKINRSNLTGDPYHLYSDFSNISTSNQCKIIPGFRTLTHYQGGEATDTTKNAWRYGNGEEGAINETGLLPAGRSASLFYTPVGKTFGPMRFMLTLAPSKSAGQGFSVAHLYMDVLIKFDASTMSGYGLRFLRTTKYSNAVDCFYVKYQNGKVTPASTPVTISCFRTPCFVRLEYADGMLTSQVSTTADYLKNYPPGVLPELKLSTEAEDNQFGGFGINFNGGAAVLIKNVDVLWK